MGDLSPEDSRTWGKVSVVDDAGNLLFGQEASADSIPVVLSTEQQALLGQSRDAIFYRGTAAAVGVISFTPESGGSATPLIDTAKMSVVELQVRSNTYGPTA